MPLPNIIKLKSGAKTLITFFDFVPEDMFEASSRYEPASAFAELKAMFMEPAVLGKIYKEFGEELEIDENEFLITNDVGVDLHLIEEPSQTIYPEYMIWMSRDRAGFNLRPMTTQWIARDDSDE